MRIVSRAMRLFFVFIFLFATIDCKAADRVTVQDYLEAKSVEDILKKKPNLRNDPPEIFADQKEIVRAILSEDLNKLSAFFDKNVSIEVGEVYHGIFQMTKTEMDSFLRKESIIYKFIFDQANVLKVMPRIVERSGTKIHTVKYCIVNGEYRVSTSAILTFYLNEPVLHGIIIRTNCSVEKCVITGFSTGGYGAGLDK
jgi:capsule polysaccharide export protein KpsE/RkpR